MCGVHHQVFKEASQITNIWFNSFTHIAIVGTNQGITKVPRVFAKQIIVHVKAYTS